MLSAMENGFTHTRYHTRLLLRALFWESCDFSDYCLLTGKDVKRAKSWLLASQMGMQPRPTILHQSFIKECSTNKKLSLKRQSACFLLSFLFIVCLLWPSIGSFASTCVFLHVLLSLSGDDYND